jgi:hypothetical protein
VEQRVGEMKTKLICVPKVIIEDERDVLERSIMGGERIQEQVMSKCFENKEWALYKRIVVGKILVVPDPLAL